MRIESKPLAPLDAVAARLTQFQELNEVAMRNAPERKEFLEGQSMGFSTALTLIKQVQRRGKVWTGSYIDGEGVVYEDYVQQVLDAHSS